MDTKRRTPIHLEDADGNCLAHGIRYGQSNVQIHWRRSIGWCAEQFHSIDPVLHCEPGIRTLVIGMPLQETLCQPMKCSQTKTEN